MLSYKTLFGLGLATITALTLNAGSATAQEKEKEEQVVEQEVVQEKKEEKVVQKKKKKEPQNIIYSEYPELSAVGEGVVLKDFVHYLPLIPSSKINLDEKFGLDAKKGNVFYEIIDTKTGLKNIISYLEKDLSSRDEQSKKERQATINYFEGLLKRILEEKSESDKQSLSNLEKSVKEGFISGEGIKDGIYVIIGKSKTTERLAENSIPILVNIRTEPEKLYVPEPEKRIEERVVDVAESEKPTKPGEKFVVERVEITGTRKKEEKPKKSLSTRLIVDGFYGKDGLKGAGVGIGYGPFSLLLNYSTRDDKIVEEIITDLSAGRTGIGTIKNTDFNSLGTALELYFNPFFVGTGINLWNYTHSVEESIVSSDGEIIKSNTNSKSKRTILGKFYAGAELPVSERFGLRAMVGYETGNGIGNGRVWGGIGGCFKFGNKRLCKK